MIILKKSENSVFEIYEFFSAKISKYKGIISNI